MTKTNKSMFKEHPIFELPPDDNIIWRYMDFWKFKKLIESESIWMSSLQSLSDQNEGEVPEPIRDKLVQNVRDNHGEAAAKGFEEIVKPNKEFKESNYVSCWNMKELESYAMWKIYTNDENAVAIKSNIGRLINSLEAEKEIKQHVGKVLYFDGSSYALRGNLFDILIRKWIYYDYEDELRIASTGYHLDRSKGYPNGLECSVCIDTLIDEIFLPVGASKPQLNKIDALLKSKGLEKSIKISGIRERIH